MNNYKDDIKQQINNSISVKQNILESNVKDIEDVVNTIIAAFKDDKKVIWFGNGGSAAED